MQLMRYICLVLGDSGAPSLTLQAAAPIEVCSRVTAPANHLPPLRMAGNASPVQLRSWCALTQQQEQDKASMARLLLNTLTPAWALQRSCEAAPLVPCSSNMC